MKRLIFLYALALLNYPLKSMNDPLEIAINTQGKTIIGEDARGKHRLFVPIIVYRNKIALRGGFIPWKAVVDADDGSEVIDRYYRHKRRKERFICNQSHDTNNPQTFKQALNQVMQKEE